MKYFIVMTGSRSHKPIGNPLVPRPPWRFRFFRSKASAEVIRPKLHAVRIDKESLRPQRFCFLYTVDLVSHFLMLPTIKKSFPSLGLEQGYYLRSCWRSQGTISNPRRTFWFTEPSRGEHANFEPIEHENYASISNVCHHGLRSAPCKTERAKED